MEKDYNEKNSADSAPEQGSYIFGLRPIIEAIEAGKEIERVFLFKDAQSELFRRLTVLLTQKNIATQWVPIERLNRITRKNHQGAIAVIASVSFASLEEVVAQALEKEEKPIVLLLDGVTDVRNFGAIVRSAECAGVHAVVVPAKGAAPINADAMKTSAGALNLVPVCKVNNIRTAIYYLKDSGFKIIGATEKAASYHYSADYKGPIAIIMGAEDTGIAKATMELVDQAVKIPIMGKIESLNVSAATSVILYEALRQRLNA